jgi:hypothetical protein
LRKAGIGDRGLRHDRHGALEEIVGRPASAAATGEHERSGNRNETGDSTQPTAQPTGKWRISVMMGFPMMLS